MNTIEYKGFQISPIPHQQKDTGMWTLDVSLTRHHDGRGESLTKKFSGGNTYKTEAEARTHSVDFGKQVIDGKYPDITTEDLL